jgi:anti-sigma factor RsiW
MAIRSPCPAPPVLELLVLGQLAGPDVAILEHHLAACPRCAAALQSLPAEDDLVRALRPPLQRDETPCRHLM